MQAWHGWLIAFVVLLLAFLVQGGAVLGIITTQTWLYDYVTSVLNFGIGAGLTVGLIISALPVLYCGLAAFRNKDAFGAISIMDPISQKAKIE